MNDNKNIQVKHSSSASELECLNVGSRIRSVRGDRSQSEYAKLLKMGISTLRRYEGNVRQPDSMALNAIYKVDGVLSDWVLRGEGPMRRAKEGAAPVIPGMPYSREQAEADMPADLLHGDLDARARREEQQKAGLTRLHDTGAMVNQVCKDVGYSPSKVTRAAINGLAMLYDINYDHLVMFVVSLKHDQSS